MIPAFNEALRLPQFLLELSQVFPHENKECEIIVVDDGSTDTTTQLAESFRLKLSNLKVLKNSVNSGKGSALKLGLQNAEGFVSVMIDADGAYDPSEIIPLAKQIEDGEADFLIGCRRLAARGKVKRSQWRALLSLTFNTLVRSVLDLPYLETQAGFKLFNSAAVKSILPSINLDRFGFDAELIYLAHRQGFKIKEFPAACRDTGPSKVKLIFDSVDLVKSLFRIRRWHRKNSS